MTFFTTTDELMSTEIKITLRLKHNEPGRKIWPRKLAGLLDRLGDEAGRWREEDIDYVDYVELVNYSVQDAAI